MADTKKEHYVPRFYLKEFCDNDEKIWVNDKRTRKTRKQKVSEIAMENYFYDLDIDKFTTDPEKEKGFKKVSDELIEKGKFDDFEQVKDFLKKYIEKDYLSKIEPLFSNLLKNISKKTRKANRWYLKNCYSFSTNEKEILSIMFANQLIRTKSMREEQKDMIEKTTSFLYNKLLKDEGESEVSVKMNKEGSKWHHISMMLDREHLETISEILKNHLWVMFINRTSKKYFTSDNPIAKIPNATNPNKGNLGVGSDGIELLFPISPDLTIGMYEKNYFSGTFSDRIFVEVYEPDLIDRFNIAQIVNSYRCIFSNKNDFSLVEKTLTKHPSYRDFKSNFIIS